MLEQPSVLEFLKMLRERPELAALPAPTLNQRWPPRKQRNQQREQRKGNKGKRRPSSAPTAAPLVPEAATPPAGIAPVAEADVAPSVGASFMEELPEPPKPGAGLPEPPKPGGIIRAGERINLHCACAAGSADSAGGSELRAGNLPTNCTWMRW